MRTADQIRLLRRWQEMLRDPQGAGDFELREIALAYHDRRFRDAVVVSMVSSQPDDAMALLRGEEDRVEELLNPMTARVAPGVANPARVLLERQGFLVLGDDQIFSQVAVLAGYLAWVKGHPRSALGYCEMALQKDPNNRLAQLMVRIIPALGGIAALREV